MQNLTAETTSSSELLSVSRLPPSTSVELPCVSSFTDNCTAKISEIVPCDENSESNTDDGTDQELLAMFRKEDQYLMPNKSQVLFYLTEAHILRIHRTGADLQITDSIDFPLFDVWTDSFCSKTTWIIESYGRTVLMISEKNQTPWCFLGRSRTLSVVVTDWNGDIFGHFLPGNPFLIRNTNAQTIAKLITKQHAEAGKAMWVCISEKSGCEIASLENYSTITFTEVSVGFHLKLLVLAAFIRLTAVRLPKSRNYCCCSKVTSMVAK
uniref:TLDc domain-containing protein n=1 Tax=Syphacia muris TaxID=451379 RepID=A0A0N5AD85_9BILA